LSVSNILYIFFQLYASSFQTKRQENIWIIYPTTPESVKTAITVLS